MALVPEFISVMRDIRDIKYPDIVIKHGEVAVNTGLTLGYKNTALTYKDEASVSASSALANKNITDANVITTNNNVATTNANASTCTEKALIASQVLAMTASASTLTAGSPASASYNPTTGIMSFGIPTGPKGDRGDAFVVNAFGLLANRTTYDGQPVNFSFYATDAGLIYFKLSNTSGDWSTGVPFGKGDTGDTGNGIISITLTGTVGSIDTYRILFTDATFFDFNVTNGSVTSVAGRTGDITLAKADVGLSNVDNTSDLLKPLSTAEINALTLKAPLISPALTGTPTVGGDAIKYLTAQPSWTGVDIGGGETLYPDGSIYGENANGSYTKYPNGSITMICTFLKTGSVVNSGLVNFSVTLPYTLLSTDMSEVSVEGNSDNSVVYVTRSYLSDTHTASFGIFNSSGATRTYSYSKAIVVGRWK